MDNGAYTATILKHELRTSNDKDYIYFEMDVSDGWGKTEQWPVKVWLTTDKAISRARSTLRKVGFDMDTPDGISPLIDDPTHLAGTPVEVEISQNGTFGQQCNIVLGDDKPMDKSKAANISAKLKMYSRDNEKPIEKKPKSNYQQSLGKAQQPPADKFAKENISAASQQAKDDGGDIPF